MSRRELIIIAVSAIFLGLCVAIPFVIRPYIVSRPAMPSTWTKLRSGMTRDQIAAAVGELNEMRELKGFDSRFEEATMLGHPCYWHLEVRYDTSGGATNAEARFIDRTSSRFSSGPHKLF